MMYGAFPNQAILSILAIDPNTKPRARYLAPALLYEPSVNLTWQPPGCVHA